MSTDAVRVRRRSRRLALVTITVLVAAPMFTGRDSFPLSTYPMYAFRRDDTDRFQLALAESATGELTPLSLRVIADTDDPLIAEGVISQAIRQGSTDTLCSVIADRADPSVVRVLVVEEIHNVVRRATGRDSLVERIVHASCAVP